MSSSASALTAPLPASIARGANVSQCGHMVGTGAGQCRLTRLPAQQTPTWHSAEGQAAERVVPAAQRGVRRRAKAASVHASGRGAGACLLHGQGVEVGWCGMAGAKPYRHGTALRVATVQAAVPTQAAGCCHVEFELCAVLTGEAACLRGQGHGSKSGAGDIASRCVRVRCAACIPFASRKATRAPLARRHGRQTSGKTRWRGHSPRPLNEARPSAAHKSPAMTARTSTPRTPCSARFRAAEGRLWSVRRAALRSRRLQPRTIARGCGMQCVLVAGELVTPVPPGCRPPGAGSQP